MFLTKLFSLEPADQPEKKTLPEMQQIKQKQESVLDHFKKLPKQSPKQAPLKRLTEIEKQELLKKSQLDVEMPSVVGTNLALLGQIHADALAHGTFLQKLPSQEASKGWAELMSQVTEVEVPQDLQNSLNQYAQTTEELSKMTDVIGQAKIIKQKVYDLKRGEAFLFEGGRNEGTTFYPIVYEWIRISEEHFDLYVYLPGKGDGLYREQIKEIGRKTWNRPVIHYQNIPAASHIFFGEGKNTKSDLFQAILEARFHSRSHPADFVTLHLLAHLQQYRNEQDSQVTSERRALTDAWASIKPYVYRKLGRENYKRAILEIKLNSLIQGYQSSKNFLKEQNGEALRIVLKRGAELILKNLASYHNMNIKISESLFTKARATAVHLIDELESIEKQLALRRKNDAVPIQNPLPNKMILQAKHQKDVESAKSTVILATPLKKSISSTRARLIELPTPASFGNVLNELVSAYAQNVTVPNIVAAEIEHLASILPIPGTTSFWSQIPSEQNEPILLSLNLLLDAYTKALTQKHVGMSAKESNTVYTFFAIIHTVALAQDRLLHPTLDASSPASLAHYPINFPGLQSDKDPYLIFTTPEDYTRRSELIAYFHSTYSQTKAYDSKEIFNLSKTYYSFQKSEGTAEYLLALAQNEHFKDHLNADSIVEWNYRKYNNYRDETNIFLQKTGLVLAGESIQQKMLASQIGQCLAYDDVADEDNILIEKGFTHLRVLTQAALISNHIKNIQESFVCKRRLPVSCHVLYDGIFGIPSYAELEVYQITDYGKPTFSSYLHPVLRDDQEKIFEGKWLQRNKSANTSFEEARALNWINPSPSTEKKTDEVAYLRASCEPSLFPYKILSYYRGNLSLFESFEEQTLFELALYRSTAFAKDYVGVSEQDALYQSTRFFPLVDAMQQKGFQEEAKRFIQEGIDRYFYRQPDQKPKVLAATLFIRLACRLARFNQGIPLIDSLDVIEKMLAVPSITEEERALLSLHQILAYGSSSENWTQGDVEKIFGAWVYYKNTSLPEKWKNHLLEREVETLVHAASTRLAKTQDNGVFQRNILTTALKQLGINLPPAFAISSDEAHLITGSVGNSFWSVNILTGEVMTENGILKRTQMPFGLQDRTFEYIFGKFNPSCFETAEAFYFSHPTMGTFRTIKKEDNSRYFYYIQKMVGDRWYQYVPPERHLKNIPRFLCGNKTHWVNTDSYYSDILICDRTSGAIVATIQGSGIIESEDKSETYYGEYDCSFLANFERPEYIHWSIDTKGKAHVSFCRYQSRGHNPLNFELENGALVFTANRKYILSSKQKPGLLGASNGSLVLVNRETGEEKVLVALQLLSQHTPLSTQHPIDVKDKHIKHDPLGEFYTDQNNRFEYLEFDVKANSLVPLSQEGTLYLVYQYLAQRRYEEAFLFLKQIDFRDALSQKSQWLLSETIKIAGDTDTSPEAAAVAMHASVMLKKAYHRMKAEGKQFYYPPNNATIASTYSRFEHQIPEKFLLNSDDLALCGLNLQGNQEKSSYPDIQRFLPAPKRAQAPIKSLNIPHANLIFSGDATIVPNSFNGWQWGSIVEEAKRHVFEETEFIPINPQPSTYSNEVHLIQDWSLKFEQGFFSEAYEIARKKKGTDEERERLIFRLNILQTIETKPKSWKYLQLALKFPDEVPDLPDPKNYKERYEFINRCAALSQRDQGVDSSPRSPRREWKPLENEGPQRPITASIIPPRSVEASTTPLKLSPFSKETLDHGFTKQLFTNYLEKKEKPPNPKIDAPECPSEDSLENDEKEFYGILQKEFSDFAKDCQKGAEINAERHVYTLKKNVNELRATLEGEIKKWDGEIANLEASILELANKHDPQEIKRTLYKEGKIEQELSLKKLADLFLQGDADAFAKANPYLRNQHLIDTLAQSYNLEPHKNLVIDYLYNSMGLYMTQCVHRTRLQRAVKLCKEIEGSTSLKQEALIQKLAEELKPISVNQAVYSIQEYPPFLVFEYLSGLTIRAEQAHLLKKLLECPDGKYINRVIQLIMGGGKTAVMAVVILKHAARHGRLSLFVTPASQYASVSYNLRKTLRDCFGIDMEEIDVSREQLARSPTMCKEILTRLQETIRTGNFLLIKAETLQTICLEFLDFLYQAAKDPEPNTELIEKINILKDILILLKEKGDALFDEVDLVLNVLQEVNFPIGEKEFLNPERIEVIRELFLLFASENVPLDDKENINLKKLIGLVENRQNLISQQEWNGIVAKAVAYNLPRKMTSLKLQENLDFCDSFERYINGTMNVLCQELLDKPDDQKIAALSVIDRKDYDFLSHVRDLSKSDDPIEQEAAHHIALVKHMMQSVLPVTMEKTGRRNYGRGGTLPGEVRPYLSVDTPSDNLHGYHWEAIAYHFQTALQCGISKEQMLHIAAVYKEQAELRSDREKKVFDQTIEAIEFKDLTGVALHELDQPQKVEEAIAHLNENVDALLRFEADTAAEYVSYYPQRLTATGQSLVNMLCTVRAMSGTPWNTPCYPSSLSANFEPALGTEGQIAEAILTRSSSKKPDKNCTHIIKSKDIEGILKEILEKHPQKNRVRMLMDSGALFKNYSNLEVAKAIRDYLRIPVLFFMRNPHKDEKTPDTLALLRVGSNQPEIIGGTRLEDIQKTGINLEEYFVYDDERHTTGTDIPLIPDAIGIMTLDESMLRRSFFQTVMREREFFLNQDVEFAIPEYLLTSLKKLYPAEHIKNEDLRLILQNLILSVKNQAITKAKHYFRSCKQKIDDVFRQNLLCEFLTEKPLTQSFIQAQFPNYESNTVTVQSDRPYNQFGALEYSVDSIDSLEAYQKRKMEQFPLGHPRRDQIEGEIKKIIDEAKESPYCPKKVMEAGSQELGIQVDILTEVAAEVNQEVDQEIEQEVLQELQLYQWVEIGALRKEEDWSDSKKVHQFLDNIRERKNTALIPLKNLFSQYNYRKDYREVFSSKVLVTPSWALATERHLPVFHRMQRPLEQILIIGAAERGYEVIALSQKEAREFKHFLHNNTQINDVWLIQSDGSSLQDTDAGTPPIQDPTLQATLVECNVFNGRIDYLEAHQQYAEAWLRADEEKHVDIKKHFLKLKVVNTPYQKRLFFKSEILSDHHKNEKQRKYRLEILARESESWDKEYIQSLTENDTAKLKCLLPHQLNQLNPEQIEWLSPNQIPDLTEPSLIKKIPKKYASQMKPEQMPHIDAEQVPWFEKSVTKTQAIDPKLCTHMTETQLKNLRQTQFDQIEDPELRARIAKLKPTLAIPPAQPQPQEVHEQKGGGVFPDEDASSGEGYFPEELRNPAPTKVYPSPIQEVSEQEKKTSVTQIVVCILVALVGTGGAVCGAFALVGALYPNAPQFTIIIYHAFQSPLFMPSAVGGGGTLLLVGLFTYAIEQCCNGKKPRHRIKKLAQKAY